MAEDNAQNSKNIDIQVGGDATLEGVAIGDRNKIISQVQEVHGHVVQADHSQVHIGDIYYYFEIPKSEVIHKDPYKFLSTYGLEDENIFFGRKAAIQELSSQILSQKFVIVNGKSGSGKSSLIHAGITPRLLRNNHLVIHVKEYLTSPLDTIQAAISSDLESSLVIFLDQFERFFIYLPLEERLRFSTALKDWLDDTTSKVRFVVAIRMDFFGRIGEFQKVIRDIYQQSAIFTLEPLNRDEAREAIEGPLEEMGIRVVYDDALITVLLDRLLEDAEIEPAQLQIVCDELYRKAKEQNVKILKEEGIYQELGGVEGMLKSYLQRKLTEYTPQDEAVKRVLKQMIAPFEISAGIRTFVEAPQIATRLNVPEAEVAPLIERLVDDRLIEKKETDGHATYSLAHEYMAGQVQEWFDPKETAIRRAKDILTHAMSYNMLMQFEEASQVKEYEQELELNAEEQDFLKKSLNKHYRWVWFRRGLVTAITVFAIIATALGWYANVQKKEADTQKQQALAARDDANRQKEQAEEARAKAERAEKDTTRQLVRNYWINGANARDKDNDPLKASHYFMKTTALTDDLIFSRNTLLAGEVLIRDAYLGATLDHASSVNGAAFSGDEAWVLTWSQDGTAQVWDSMTGQPLTPPLEHQRAVNGAVFSQDERRVLTWSNDGTARVWDSTTGQPLIPPLKHTSYVGGAVFTADETRVLTWTGDGTARVWDSTTGQPLIPPLEHNKGRVRGAIFSANERRVLTWSSDDTVRVWDSMTGQPLTPPLEHQSPVNGAVFSQDESRVLTWSQDGTVRVWDSMTGQPLTPPLEHQRAVNGAVFSQDERRVLTWSNDGTTRVWDSTTGQPLIPPLKHTSYVGGAVFTADESRVLTWSGDGTARVWDSTTGQPLIPPLKHTSWVNGALFTADESRVLTWSQDGTARVWDSTTGQPLIPPMKHKDEIYGAAFSANERRVLTWSRDGTARVWDSATGQSLISPLKHNNEVNGAVFSQDESRILTWSGDEWAGSGMARVWKIVTTQSLIPPLKHNKEVKGAVFSTDAVRVLTWSQDGTARVWDSATGQPLTPPLEHKGSVQGAVFSQDGDRILTWSFDGPARVWGSATGQPLTPSLEHKGSVQGAVFSTDESRILTWSLDGTARVWDSETGQPLILPLEHQKSIDGAVFSQDAARVLTWSRDGTARVWDSVTGKPLTPPLEHKDTVGGAIFSTDAARVLTWSNDGTARIWDSATGQPLTSPLEHKGWVYGAVFSQDESRVLTWGDTARVWDSTTGKLLIPPLEHKGPVQGAVFSTDESQILTWSSLGGTVRVWDSATGQPLTPPMKHYGTVQGAVFSAEAVRVLTWTYDGAAQVWDSATGQPLTPLLKHTSTIRGAVFSRDESKVLTWSSDGTARVWDSATGQPLLPPMEHEKSVSGAIFSQDEGRVLTWSQDGTARVWDFRADYDFPREYFILRLQVQTGTQLNDVGEIEVLLSEKWKKKKRQYEKIAWEHLKVGQYPQANRLLGYFMNHPESCDRIEKWLQEVNPDVVSKAASKYARICLNRGSFYLKQKDYEQAARAFGTSLQLLTDYPSTSQSSLAEAYERLARTLIESTQDVEQGLEYARTSLELNSFQQPDRAFKTLALGYRQQGRSIEAAKAYVNLGQEFSRWKDHVSALEAYQQAISLWPEIEKKIASEYAEVRQKVAEFYSKLIETYFEQKKYEEAGQVYEQTIRYGFGDAETNGKWFNALAWKLINEDIGIDKGIAYAQKSLELDPDQNPAWAMDTLALGYIKQGRHAEAVKLLEQALEKAPDEKSRQTLQERMQQAQEGLK